MEQVWKLISQLKDNELVQGDVQFCQNNLMFSSKFCFSVFSPKFPLSVEISQIASPETTISTDKFILKNID